MRDLHEAAGALFGSVAGVDLPRHYGDPSAEYQAAVDGVGVVDRSHRARVVVSGNAALQMLSGILTGRMPLEPSGEPGGVMSGRGEYSAVLTPKGRMLADLRAFRVGQSEEEGALLDVSAAGSEALKGHLTKFLPPRLALAQDVSAGTGMLTILGAGSPGLLAGVGLLAGLTESDLTSMEEDEYRLATGAGDSVRVVRTNEVRPFAFDVFAEAEATRALWGRVTEAGAEPVGQGVWQTLRVEAGRPAYGQDMDDTTILYEAGIVERAVDHTKGCYTGQEVIVRIRDRGHVNRLLRGLLLGDAPIPAVGTELFAGPEGKAVGRITSAVTSPHFGEAIALGYVRREVEPPAQVRVGAKDGPGAEVRELSEAAWLPRTG